jgi:hypothetical protein
MSLPVHGLETATTSDLSTDLSVTAPGVVWISAVLVTTSDDSTTPVVTLSDGNGDALIDQHDVYEDAPICASYDSPVVALGGFTLASTGANEAATIWYRQVPG